MLLLRISNKRFQDIVVGADGIRSKIRAELQSAAALNGRLDSKDKEGEELIE
jgi:2-polyprenyl-6-methoxyphenol hydroxylase-like FAD-dependent oxidoreductase